MMKQNVRSDWNATRGKDWNYYFSRSDIQMCFMIFFRRIKCVVCCCSFCWSFFCVLRFELVLTKP